MEDFTEVDILDSLQLSTVLLTDVGNTEKQKQGTGFFFMYRDDDNLEIGYPVIVSTRHVLEGMDMLRFSWTTTDKDGHPQLGKMAHQIFMNVHDYLLIHPTEDLAILSIGSIINQIGGMVAMRAWDENHILSKKHLNTINVAHRILMIGYPLNIMDRKNYVPIFRQGITATNPALDFNGRQEFAIDIACFPGSSGSPIFAYDDGLIDVDENRNQIYGKSIAFIGIQRSTYTHTTKGEIELPDKQVWPITVQESAHLGMAINARALKDLKQPLMKLVRGSEKEETV